MKKPRDIWEGCLFNYTPVPNYPPIVVKFLEWVDGKARFSFTNESGVHEGTCPRDCLNGIPLTSDWIERCGFKKDTTSDHGTIYFDEKNKLNIVEILSNPYGEKLEGFKPFTALRLSGSRDIHLKFVHDLQVACSHEDIELTIT